MLDTICTLPLTSDLFAQSIHPTSPLLALGLATGHVQIHCLPPSSPDGTSSCDGHDTIETAWRTRRHKGSCRALAFSHDGAYLFSAGTDGLVKSAVTETGQVMSKIAVPLHNSATDAPTLINPLTPQSFLLATDSSALHIYDLRAKSTFATSIPQQTHHPHDDYISSLTPLPPGENSTSGFTKQWASTGGTTVAVTDLRRGVLVKSEDMGEELLSSCNIGNKIFVGGERGVLRGWEIGEWDEEEERVNVARGESLDVLSSIPEEAGGNKWGGDLVAVGLGDGKIRVVKIGKGKGRVVAEMMHDEVEPVMGMGFEIGGRMISGGGSAVKIWQESVGEEVDHEDDEDAVAGAASASGVTGGSSDDGEDEKSEESSEEEKTRKRRKKRKRGKGKDQGNEKNVIKLKGLD